jgi:hypothetical protein
MRRYLVKTAAAICGYKWSNSTSADENTPCNRRKNDEIFVKMKFLS